MGRGDHGRLTRSLGLRHVFALALWLATREYGLSGPATVLASALLVHGGSIAAAWVTERHGHQRGDQS